MLHIILDQYDCDLLSVIEKTCFEEYFICLSLHLDVGPISQIREKGLSANALTHSFIQDYDGLFYGNGAAWAVDQEQKLNEIVERASNGEEVTLWHRVGSAESACAFYFLISLLKSTGATMWEGIHLTEILMEFRFHHKRISCENIDQILFENKRQISPALAERFSRKWEMLEAENANLRVFFGNRVISVNYDYYDNFILSFFPQDDKSIPIKVVLHNIFKEIGGRSFLWEAFIIFRLYTLKDEGKLEYVSSLSHYDGAPIAPEIYEQRWRRKDAGRQQQGDCDDQWFEELNKAISKGDDEETTFLLHNFPLNIRSVDKLCGLLQTRWNDEICAAVLVRLWEYLTFDQRCDLLEKLGSASKDENC